MMPRSLAFFSGEDNKSSWNFRLFNDLNWLQPNIEMGKKDETAQRWIITAHSKEERKKFVDDRQRAWKYLKSLLFSGHKEVW